VVLDEGRTVRVDAGAVPHPVGAECGLDLYGGEVVHLGQGGLGVGGRGWGGGEWGGVVGGGELSWSGRDGGGDTSVVGPLPMSLPREGTGVEEALDGEYGAVAFPGEAVG